MNAKIRWICRFAFVLTVMFQSAGLLRAQVLIDPRGEDTTIQDLEDESTSEATSTESVTEDEANGAATSEDLTAASRTAATQESLSTARRPLPPPQGPNERVPVRRTPPPRPEAALPERPTNELAAEQPRGTGRPYLGITFDSTVRDSAIVGAIVPDSPAEQAGLRPGDVVEAINGQRIASIEDAFAVVARLRPGEVIDVEFSRRVSARTQAMLESAPDDANADTARDTADTRLDTLPERRTTSYREPPRARSEEPIQLQRDYPQDRIRVLRRYEDNQMQSNPNEDDRRRLDRRELEELLRERQREQQRPFRNRPLLPWRRG